MNDFERKIIDKLLIKYQNSKLSKEGSERNIKIKIDNHDPIMKTYQTRDSYKYKDSNDETIKTLTSKGFIESFFSRDGEFQYLTLNIENVDVLYEYVGSVNPKIENEKIVEYLIGIQLDDFLYKFKKFVLNQIETKYTFPKTFFSNAEELKTIIHIIQEIIALDDEVMKRDFSVRVLGDSKKFKNKYEAKVINIIKEFDPNAENIDKEDILKNYNIVSNYSYTLIKHKLLFKLGDAVIDLNKLPYDFALSNHMIRDLEIMKTDIIKVITVENLTTFYGLNEDALIIYLAGFHNNIKQQLLKKIYETYPNAIYLHFSDIDFGGFWIYHNLKVKTGIPFKPYKMSIKELEDNKKNLKKLTVNDVNRLESLLENSKFVEFYDVIRYMLKNNCKLEQEILD